MDENKKTTDNQENGKGYNLDEFDDDYIIPSGGNTKEQNEPEVDYGDNFVMENGEDDSGYTYEIDNEDSYDETKSLRRRKKASRVAAIVFLVLAIICLIAAVIFALTQCTGGKAPENKKETTASTSVQIEANAQQSYQSEEQSYASEQTAEPQQEYSQTEEQSAQSSQSSQEQSSFASQTSEQQSSEVSEQSSQQSSESSSQISTEEPAQPTQSEQSGEGETSDVNYEGGENAD